jgi:D-alanyl-D-alanine carboxypeptidase
VHAIRRFRYGNRRADVAAAKPRARCFHVVATLAVALALLAAAGQPAKARYASFVMDMTTGRVLHAVNADTRNYPASLTKMMTLYMTFEALEEGRLRLTERMPVSRRAAGMTPSELGLRPGERITVKEAILGLVTKSANDAAVVLAEALGGTEYKFALDMTRKARQLGMERTTFRNASGLPNRGQLSTARDMAKLGKALIEDFPEYYDYFDTRRFTYDGHTYGNHNNLLGDYRGTDGIKTGYIRASGFNLVASVKRHGHRLIGVVFGGRSAQSRDRHMVDLLDKGFRKVRRLQTVEIVGPPEPKPIRAIRNEVAALRGEDDVIAMGDADPNAHGDDALRTGTRTASGAPLPPATKRPEAIRAAARALATADGSFAIQVGAYSRASWAHDAAVAALNKAPRLLRTSRLSVTRFRSEADPIYRARLAALSRDRARQACRVLESQGTNCLVIQPRGGIEVAVNDG